MELLRGPSGAAAASSERGTSISPESVHETRTCKTDGRLKSRTGHRSVHDFNLPSVFKSARSEPLGPGGCHRSSMKKRKRGAEHTARKQASRHAHKRQRSRETIAQTNAKQALPGCVVGSRSSWSFRLPGSSAARMGSGTMPATPTMNSKGNGPGRQQHRAEHINAGQPAPPHASLEKKNGKDST